MIDCSRVKYFAAFWRSNINDCHGRNCDALLCVILRDSVYESTNGAVGNVEILASAGRQKSMDSMDWVGDRMHRLPAKFPAAQEFQSTFLELGQIWPTFLPKGVKSLAYLGIAL